MTDLDHLQSAENALKSIGRHTLAHVLQDAREEITKLRAENAEVRKERDLIRAHIDREQQLWREMSATPVEWGAGSAAQG